MQHTLHIKQPLAQYLSKLGRGFDSILFSTEGQIKFITLDISIYPSYN